MLNLVLFHGLPVFVILYLIFYADTEFLLRFLRYCKFSQLEARKRIETYLTGMTKYADYLMDIDITEKDVLDVAKGGWVPCHSIHFYVINTLRPRQCSRHVTEDIFFRSFSWMKIVLFQFKYHRFSIPRVSFSISHLWFTSWHGTEQATSHYMNQWGPNIYWRIYTPPECGKLIIWGKVAYQSIAGFVFLISLRDA